LGAEEETLSRLLGDQKVTELRLKEKGFSSSPLYWIKGDFLREVYLVRMLECCCRWQRRTWNESTEERGGGHL